MIDKLKEKLANINKVALVFGVGLVGIFLVVFYLLRSAVLVEEVVQIQEVLPQKVKQDKTLQPSYLKQQKPAWESTSTVQEKIIPIAKLKEVEPKVEKNNLLNKNKIKEIIARGNKAKIYTCRLLKEFEYFSGKEIIYYIQETKSHKKEYQAIHKLDNWNQNGIVLTQNFMAINIDLSQKMVEIEKDKWIPALYFSKCDINIQVPQ